VKRLTVLIFAGCGRIAFDPLSDGISGSDAPAGPLLLFDFEASDPLENRAGSPDATCTACPTQVAGARGAFAAHFDGTACLVVAANALRPSQFTFAAWAKPQGSQNSNIIGRAFLGATTSSNTFEATVQPITLPYSVFVNSVQAQGFATLDAWHHVAGVFDGQNLQLWLDGGYVSSVAVGVAQYTDDPITIGCDIDFNTPVFHFTGDIDEVRLYDRALAPDELTALAN
jgi:hypothetical protein